MTVFIYHEPLASPEQTILNYLKKSSSITNSEARAITGLKSENSMKQVFDRLRKEGLIELIPDRRGSLSAWQLIGKEKPQALAQQLELDWKSSS